MKKDLIILIEQEALDEINDAFDFYEERKPGLGEEFKVSLNESFEIILSSTKGYIKTVHHRQFPM
jgi:hypothetical protein